MRGFSLTLAVILTFCTAPARAETASTGSGASIHGNQPASVGPGLVLPVQFEATLEKPAAEPVSESHASSAPASEANSLELPSRSDSLTRIDSPSGKGPAGALGTVLGSLAIVIGLFLLVVWVTRRANPRSAQLLPSEAVEVLGRAPLPGKQHMQLLRVGRKLLLVCTTASGMETLTEVTEPDEVERLTALCQQNSPTSVTGTFRQVLSNLNQEPPAKKGRLGREARALARSRQEVFQGGSGWEGGDA